VPTQSDRKVKVQQEGNRIVVLCTTNGQAVASISMGVKTIEIHVGGDTYDTGLSMFIRQTGMSIVRTDLTNSTFVVIRDKDGDLLPDERVTVNNVTKESNRQVLNITYGKTLGSESDGNAPDEGLLRERSVNR
jgi:hypothetical protein